jgi:hypothetical protein
MPRRKPLDDATLDMIVARIDAYMAGHSSVLFDRDDHADRVHLAVLRRHLAATRQRAAGRKLEPGARAAREALFRKWQQLLDASDATLAGLIDAYASSTSWRRRSAGRCDRSSIAGSGASRSENNRGPYCF